ncbi:unnamed protein product [Lactuca saligna]|uniref:Uncharacterized protein n=1 Tax=Lactuca saligna TaxID=75948 RepID=A0AA35VCU0_LACSI|nr:unnamed protein product [Lactuca saligna]
MYTLHVNLGALTAGYFNLKNKLIAEFDDKFNTTIEDPKAAKTSQFAPSNTSQSDQLDNNPPVRTTTIVDQFEIKPTQTPQRVTLKRARQSPSSKKMGKWLFMKNSDQDVRGDEPQLTMINLKKRQFRDSYVGFSR